MSKTALVAGGTGLVGRHLVELLLETKVYDEVKVLVRKGSKRRFNGVSLIEVDYDRLVEFKDELVADRVYCCLGTTMKQAGSKDNFYKVDFTYPYELAKYTKENGSMQYNIITASGANSDSSFYYNRVKGQVEAAISKLTFASTNILRPSLLLGERDESRVGEKIASVIAKVVNPLLVGRAKKHRAIHAQTVARAMLNISLENKRGVSIFQSDVLQEKGSG